MDFRISHSALLRFSGSRLSTRSSVLNFPLLSSLYLASVCSQELHMLIPTAGTSPNMVTDMAMPAGDVRLVTISDREAATRAMRAVFIVVYTVLLLCLLSSRFSMDSNIAAYWAVRGSDPWRLLLSMPSRTFSMSTESICMQL